MSSTSLRSHSCGELTAKHAKKSVILCGWVNTRRDHGGLIFFDLRDRYGLTQIVFHPETDKEAFRLAETVRPEWVLQVEGTVKKREKDAVNPKMPTGEIEVTVTKLTVLNKAKTPPFEIDSPKEVNEELRLQYRYLDMRTARMQRNIVLRSKIFQIIRRYFTSKDCLEIDTPCLIKGTPEGAREYIVPSRVYPGTFFVLPQSPQQLKQLCMVGGLDRYFQIARCFRDEDLRGDRQPEFLQLDFEMSFPKQEDVQEIIEGSIVEIIKECSTKKIKGGSVPKYTWKHVMDTYGSDKPDLRFDLPIVDITPLIKGCGFKVFEDALTLKNGVVRALRVPGGAALSRSEIDAWTVVVRELKAKGLAYILFKEDGPQSPLLKFFKAGFLEKLQKATGAEKGDALFFGADAYKIVCASLGRIRAEAAKRFKLIDETTHSLFWVTNFPMFEENDDGTLTFSHHPFTSPNMDEWAKRKEEPLKVHSICYDLVLDGYELGSGSIRIHDPVLQAEVFEMLGINSEDQERRFGHMLRAFEYGAPPHGGFAYGIDRVVMILAGEPNIREVTPFPKDQKAKDLLLGAPAAVPEVQLKELRIRLEDLDA
ncbi:MAG: aspartate--tRNA ligase [Candidatus Peribacteraceae bacterium]|nr:aspartate--tRNA ligase [Candidatus Peribacteraceae bacterium]